MKCCPNCEAHVSRMFTVAAYTTEEEVMLCDLRCECGMRINIELPMVEAIIQHKYMEE